MSINLLETIQKNLNYPPLKKIDPNTQEVTADNNAPSEDRFAQAAIPAMLTGIYRYSTADEGAENILRGDISTDWVTTVFEERTGEVIEKVAQYSFQPVGTVHQRMNEIAWEAVGLVREEIKTDADKMNVKDYIAGQRNSILLYLPAALHLGELLEDDTLDDNTHKMEGPVSSLMNKIGAAFSKPADEEEVKSGNSK